MHELLIIFDTIEHVNIVSGVALNSLLLFLIRRYSRKDLGEYKTLLTAFAGFDIFLCIVHFVISPVSKLVLFKVNNCTPSQKVISYDTTFSVVANSFWESRHITLIYVSIFTVPFAIMNINFLYRYWSIKNPQRLLFFSKPYFKLAVFLYAFTAYSMWHLLSWWGTSGEIDEIGTVIARGLHMENYNRTIIDGWLLMDHWVRRAKIRFSQIKMKKLRNDEFNVRAGVLLIAVDIIMITSLTVASILGCLTFYFIYKAKTLSMAFRSFQVKLMSALCAQTFVPFVCVYFPYFCVVTFPFLRIPDPHISDACTMLTSCFPTWDAMVIILLMKDYREGLITLICCRKSTVAGETVWKTATSAISVGVSQVSNVSQVNSSVVPLEPAAPPRGTVNDVLFPHHLHYTEPASQQVHVKQSVRVRQTCVAYSVSRFSDHVLCGFLGQEVDWTICAKPARVYKKVGCDGFAYNGYVAAAQWTKAGAYQQFVTVNVGQSAQDLSLFYEANNSGNVPKDPDNVSATESFTEDFTAIDNAWGYCQVLIFSSALIQVALATTCYSPTIFTTQNQLLSKTTLATQLECDKQCAADPKCVAYSVNRFSDHVLCGFLGQEVDWTICAKPARVYKKNMDMAYSSVHLLIVQCIEYFNIVCGALLNLLLIYLIQRFSKKNMGQYKILLTVFSGFDIFLCFCHWFIAPKCINFETTFSVVAHSFWESRQITLVYCSVFTVPFGIMNINFLYRYWSIKDPEKLQFFAKRYFKLLLFLYAAGAYSAWHFLSYLGSSGAVDEVGTIIARGIYKEKYGIEIEDGWLLMDHWRDGKLNVPAALLLAAADGIMIASFAFASLLGSLTFYHIQKAQTISLAFRKQQLMILTALLAQTFVPLICVYIPYFCVITFPFFDLPDEGLADSCTILITCFPIWDAIVITMLMKDYRNGFLTVICRRQGDTDAVSVWKTDNTQSSSVRSNFTMMPEGDKDVMLM
ncbi:hypothetical protein PRIPAC_83144 [Pristionchus pacificus]|uniref:G protein-coupled receptor n=1 Tax=Pristionchus pacificus TaxID=54126 RepID=A0A2A6BTH6_PRIPA|nr:hypothetical protein PRIPAC_83144 [Pristionchus pacificus]|eukprot:PDM69195.1 G protein-coupled receptor [Pristionchus pacificus]